jgi:transposase InsO family protein
MNGAYAQNKMITVHIALCAVLDALASGIRVDRVTFACGGWDRASYNIYSTALKCIRPHAPTPVMAVFAGNTNTRSLSRSGKEVARCAPLGSSGKKIARAKSASAVKLDDAFAKSPPLASTPMLINYGVITDVERDYNMDGVIELSDRLEKELNENEHATDLLCTVTAADNDLILSLPETPLDIGELVSAQKEEPDFVMRMNYITRGTMPRHLPKAEVHGLLCNINDYFVSEEGVLYHIWYKGSARKTQLAVAQLCVPTKYREAIIVNSHQNGHFSDYKMFLQLKNEYFWTFMQRDIRRIVQSCSICSYANRRNQRRAPLNPQSVASGPFEAVHVDTLRMSETSHGMNYVVVMVCAFSRLTRCVAVKRKTAANIADAIYRSWISCYGVPECMHVTSDNGGEYTGTVTQYLFKAHGIRTRLTSFYAPSSNSVVERENRSILEILRRLVENKPRQWFIYLDACTNAINSTVNLSTEAAPFELVHGVKIRLPNLMRAPPIDKAVPGTEREIIENWRDKLECTRNIARAVMAKAQKAQKEQYDRKTKETTISVGDVVCRKIEVLPRCGYKLAYKYEGAYEVINFTSPTNVQLYDMEAEEFLPRYLHINKLKKLAFEGIDPANYKPATVGKPALREAPARPVVEPSAPVMETTTENRRNTRYMVRELEKLETARKTQHELARAPPTLTRRCAADMSRTNIPPMQGSLNTSLIGQNAANMSMGDEEVMPSPEIIVHPGEDWDYSYDLNSPRKAELEEKLCGDDRPLFGDDTTLARLPSPSSTVREATADWDISASAKPSKTSTPGAEPYCRIKRIVKVRYANGREKDPDLYAQWEIEGKSRKGSYGWIPADQVHPDTQDAIRDGKLHLPGLNLGPIASGELGGTEAPVAQPRLGKSQKQKESLGTRRSERIESRRPLEPVAQKLYPRLEELGADSEGEESDATIKAEESEEETEPEGVKEKEVTHKEEDLDSSNEWETASELPVSPPVVPKEIGPPEEENTQRDSILACWSAKGYLEKLLTHYRRVDSIVELLSMNIDGEMAQALEAECKYIPPQGVAELHKFMTKTSKGSVFSSHHVTTNGIELPDRKGKRNRHFATLENLYQYRRCLFDKDYRKADYCQHATPSDAARANRDGSTSKTSPSLWDVSRSLILLDCTARLLKNNPCSVYLQLTI